MPESFSWGCACGRRVWLHHETCEACGAERPLPPPAPPSNDVRDEPKLDL